MLHVVRFPSSSHFLGTSPLRNDSDFWSALAPQDLLLEVIAVFFLHMVTLLLRPRLIHYYGFICHLTPLRLTLKLPLESLLPFSGMMPGFPSYCAGSLLLIPSSSTFCLCPHIGLRDISHTHPDNLPNQVRFRYGPSTSYHFLQTPPLASDALVSRILFPVDGARSLLSERRGLPASLG